MNTLNLLREGFASALTWAHLGWAFAGVTLGISKYIMPMPDANQSRKSTQSAMPSQR